MIVVGIDPGKHGGIVVLVENRVAELIEIPLVCGKGRDEYDIETARRILASITAGVHVAIEKSQPLPPMRKDGKVLGGGITNYQRGVARGWEWLAVGLGRPYSLVSPRSWQAAMLRDVPGNDTKQRSILAAQRLWPGVDWRRTPKCRTAHDGFTDAALLAEYVRRRVA